MFSDSLTGFPVGDPSVSPFPASYVFSKEQIDLSPFILSSSGWRKIFSADQNEESCVSAVSPEDRERLVLIGIVLCEFFKRKTGKKDALIAVGIDSRYTGPAIADILIRTFLVNGLRVRYLFISAAPEIMAYTRIDEAVDGFAYISASHNPVGHNGLKVGLSSGGIIGGKDADRLIADLLRHAETARDVAGTIDGIRELPSASVEEVFSAIRSGKA